MSEDTLLTTLEDVGNLGDIDMDLLNNVEFNTSVDTQQHSTEFLSQSSELPEVDICVGGFSPVPPTTPQLVSGSPVSPQVIKNSYKSLNRINRNNDDQVRSSVIVGRPSKAVVEDTSNNTTLLAGLPQTVQAVVNNNKQHAGRKLFKYYIIIFSEYFSLPPVLR